MQMPAKLEALAEEMRLLSTDRTFGIGDGEHFRSRGHSPASLYLSCFHHCQLTADLCIFNRDMHGSSTRTGDLDVDTTDHMAMNVSQYSSETTTPEPDYGAWEDSKRHAEKSN